MSSDKEHKPMKDYTAMDNEQLSIEVTKRKTTLTVEDRNGMQWWVFTLHMGERVLLPKLENKTEDDAWGYLVRSYKSSWADDANEALKLIEPDGFTIDYTDRGYEVKLDYGLARVGVDAKFGRAVCIAWLMWQDTKEKASSQ